MKRPYSLYQDDVSEDDLVPTDLQDEDEVQQSPSEPAVPSYKSRDKVVAGAPDILRLPLRAGIPTDNIQIGESYELLHEAGTPPEFIRVTKVLKSKIGCTDWVYGYLMKPTHSYEERLPVHDEDLVLDLESWKRYSQQALENGTIKRETTKLVCRRDVVWTNADHTRHAKESLFHEHFPRKVSQGRLFCRWVCIKVFDKSGDSKEKYDTEMTYRKMTEEEADSGHRVSDVQKFLKSQELHPGKTYQAIDICSGLGGASKGMELAGLRVRMAVDSCLDAMRTYKLNCSGGCFTLRETVDSFLQRDDGLQPDVLHISFSCKYFSRAHSKPGPSDSRNIALFYTLGRLLDSRKPRIVTMEQVPGLKEPRHMAHFNRMMYTFMDRGYSVRCKVVDMSEFGLPQKRMRLILIASCPGTTVPRLPTPTHGSGTLRPKTTVGDILDRIAATPNLTEHNVNGLRALTQTPYSRSSLLPAICTNGGERYFTPDGKRAFTIRELATLQGLPLVPEFKFVAGMSPTKKKVQIGNAVPTIYQLQLMKSIVAHLRLEDTKMVTYQQTAQTLDT